MGLGSKYQTGFTGEIQLAKFLLEKLVTLKIPKSQFTCLSFVNLLISFINYFANEEGVNVPRLVLVNPASCRRLAVHAHGTVSRESLRLLCSTVHCHCKAFIYFNPSPRYETLTRYSVFNYTSAFWTRFCLPCWIINMILYFYAEKGREAVSFLSFLLIILISFCVMLSSVTQLKQYIKIVCGWLGGYIVGSVLSFEKPAWTWKFCVFFHKTSCSFSLRNLIFFRKRVPPQMGAPPIRQ